jgi:glycosyltransferase involved in cell wall biosynthesis
MTANKKPNKRILTFPSDKNGCGFYRNMIPLNYCVAANDWDVTFLFQFVFDLNLVKSANVIRFQRQCTENQYQCVKEYKSCIQATKSPAKIMYELDDLVHGIEPHNIIAYQYYTPIRKRNVVEIMKMSDRVTFSTQFLVDFYKENFRIHNSMCVPNFLPKFLWHPDYTIDKRPDPEERDGEKPVIIWAGSASHVGPGGDLEFMIPMIEATLDEFTWHFIGVAPPKIKDKVKFTPWSHFYAYPNMMQSIKADLALAPVSDTTFNLAKSDLKYLEYAAMNIPCLCSTIGKGKGPYDLTNCINLVENDPDAWYQGIKDLLSNEEKYYETIMLQHEFLDQRWLEDNLDTYEAAFNF